MFVINLELQKLFLFSIERSRTNPYHVCSTYVVNIHFTFKWNVSFETQCWAPRMIIKMGIARHLVVTLLLPWPVRAQVIAGQENVPTGCSGSLVLITSDKNRTSFETGRLKLKVTYNIAPTKISRAEVQGCGCFYIFSQRDGKRMSHLLRTGDSLTSGDRGFFSTVRSVQVVRCYRVTTTRAIVVFSAVLVVLLVATGAVIVTRRQRQEEQDQPHQQETEETQL